MIDSSDTSHRLTKSYKNCYPFKIGTTSFIHPAGYADNVALIGPYVDEIELLFFESLSRDTTPLKAEIQRLDRLARDLEVTRRRLLVSTFGGTGPSKVRQP